MLRFHIRHARSLEAPRLTALCRRSKAHWGYDKDFLRASEPALTVTQERIARGRVLVADDAEGNLIGIAAAEPRAEGAFDLSLLFVEPAVIGRRVGEKLFAEMVSLLKREGCVRLLIESDPNAGGFYERVGAKRIGEVPSESIPGRTLPLYEYMIAR
jgi:GNAT superfamily N-acetyltransferase